MSHDNINVLDLPKKAQASFSEKNGTACVQANDPVSALQAVARHASIKILLPPADVERLTGAGQIDIVLNYANNPAAATKAAKEIDDMATTAYTVHQGEKQKRSFWRIVSRLALATATIAVGFAIAFALLNAASGTRALLGL